MISDTGADAIATGRSVDIVRPQGAKASPNQVLAIVCVGICLANLDLFVVNVGCLTLPAIFATLRSRICRGS
jgi:hypothetical protein